jgi:hypothetical protein
MAWGSTESALLVLNVGLVALVVWALRRKVLLKLAEVEDRHLRNAPHRGDGGETSQAERS